MSITCITSLGLPGIRPCTYRGEHTESCDSDTCTGCLPRLADRGFLCAACFDRVEGAVIKWPSFRRLVIETEGRVVSPDNGGIKGSSPSGYSNLPLTVLILDECDRLLKSQAGQTVDAWVHTEEGAADAVMFAHAAERAYRSLEVEQRPARVERHRCPFCHSLPIGPNPHRVVRGVYEVHCQWERCGRLLATISDYHPTFVMSLACANGDHHTCPDVGCRCDCHLVRNRSLYTVSTPAHLLAGHQPPADARTDPPASVGLNRTPNRRREAQRGNHA